MATAENMVKLALSPKLTVGPSYIDCVGKQTPQVTPYK